jgi:adenosylcobalamin-dependent ribonucleoside-diphosphate reductase
MGVGHSQVGLRIPRRFTVEGHDPYESIKWVKRDSRITNPDGSVVFEVKDAEVPSTWSQVATDIIVSKYFRKAGVPQVDGEGRAVLDESGSPVLGSEISSRQVFDRLATTWRWWGETHGYFATPSDAQAYEDEMKFMLANQIASPNSPQWFNTGLAHAYDITGTAQGFWFVDPVSGEMTESPDAYTHPAPHACFINSVSDDLVNPGGIMDLWVREARLFKMGSGTGSNFSQIRAENEKLSGGGKSSGVMGFLRIGDRAAGAIKSGGTTRRAAKMVILDLDHPDIEEFINWKKHEEDKARVLIQHGGYPADFNGEAYATVSGQNSNNSVRVPSEFIEAVRTDRDWNLTDRITGKVRKTLRARDLWRKVAEAAWACADPGVQFDTIINEWHTSPAGGKIRATNPCSEYVFLDDTACNLASINLGKFYDDESGRFDIESYEHAIRLWTITLEVSVTMAHFPSREIARGSYDYRTLGLGYANLGTLLMRMGLPYDSNEGRAVAGAITAILTGYAYATSAELASAIGPFPKFAENRDAMLRVIRNHRRASYDVAQSEYDGLSHYVMGIDAEFAPHDLLTAARQSWDLALDMGERHGYRNAQVTVIAPTGCLVGGSLIPTERGLVRLRSLGDPQGERWQYLGLKVGTDEGPQTATNFYLNGSEPVITVTTARGYRIQGTPTHRIKVVGRHGRWNWKRFAEISAEDLVPLQLGQLFGEHRDVRLSDIGEVTPDVAELIGLVVGFGRVIGDELVIGGNQTEVALLLKRAFGEETATNGAEIAVSLVAKPRLRALAAFAGLHTIPDPILATNNAEIYRAFSSQLVGVAVEESLARDLQNVQLAIGLPSELVAADGGYQVKVSADFTEASYVLDAVETVELGDEQWTFDLSVPANVTYVANGFVSHNTIGLQMDCDTTGVEPDFALVKFKKLAGGGYFKIVNQSVAPALKNLGYEPNQIEDIVRYIVGTSSLEGAPHINKPALLEKGFDALDLAKIEKALPAVFELKHAFNPFVLGEPAMQRLGFTADEYATFDFDLLRSLGYSSREIREATEWVCGQQMVEGAPHLADDHLAVFDTANRNGRNGRRLIHHSGHIKMLAATQPFLSGAASKTINLPNEATIEDIEESYMLSFELGVKCMALYRDGSKASQPLSAGSDDAQSDEESEAISAAHEIDKKILWGKIPAGMSPTQAYSQGMHPPRFILPPRRSGYTQEARIGGHKVYVRTGEYDDGTLGELFIDLAKEGATLRGILSCFAIAVSKGLQFGVPLEEFVDTFTFQTFEPRGMVEGHPNIKMANSIVDYVFRALAVEYLKRDDLAQVPPNREGELPEPKKGLAIDAGVQLDLTDAVAEGEVSAVVAAVKMFERKTQVVATEARVMQVASASDRDAGTAAMQSALGGMMGDAPLCDTCGHITIRNGSCYKCLNCGNSLGCS